jgi:hypothetical protein
MADSKADSQQIEEKQQDGSRPSSEWAYLVDDPAVERRITRKLDRHILPWIFILWLLAFIDRSNIGKYGKAREGEKEAPNPHLQHTPPLPHHHHHHHVPKHGRKRKLNSPKPGNAKLDGLIDDLKLTGTKYNVALTVFYILYVLLDIPSNWLLKVVGGGRYLPLLAMAWGIVGTCMGAVQSYAGLIACRILLGACEGGMFGGISEKRRPLVFPPVFSGRLGALTCCSG